MPHVPHQHSMELTCLSLCTDADLARALGTLRYLSTLKAARERQQASNAPQQRQQQQQQQQQAADAAGPSTSSAGAAAPALGTAAASTGPASSPVIAAAPAELCPVCQEELGSQCVVLPCGHQLCYQCSEALTSRIPPSTPMPHRRVACPTCRVRAHISDIAYVDGSRGACAHHVTYTSMLGSSQRRASTGGAGSQGAQHVPQQCDGSGMLQHMARSDSPTASVASELQPWRGEESVAVRGSYGSKVEAVVRRIMHLLHQDATARILVFSR